MHLQNFINKTTASYLALIRNARYLFYFVLSLDYLYFCALPECGKVVSCA